MEKVVKVKPCCYVCKHYIISFNKGYAYCSLHGHFVHSPTSKVCLDFELLKQLRPEVVKNEAKKPSFA